MIQRWSLAIELPAIADCLSIDDPEPKQLSTGGGHVLFIGNAVSPAPGGWAQRLRDKPVLLVTDEPEGLRHGGMLNFLLVQGKLRFEASVPSADRSGLKLSSRLLAVAERVVTTP